MRILLSITVFFLLSTLIIAQKSPVKFGKISADDFSKKIYPIDSNANAVVIADIGSSEILGNSKGWFSLEFKHYRRVHILNKNGYDEANVEIPLFSNGRAEEELNGLRAVSYNLENGKVVETKLDKGGVFKDQLSKHWMLKKFTFPNIKEGTIIEYEYTVNSDFIENLQPWEFQGEAPVLWSEYNLRLPEFFGYVFLTQGYLKYDISDKKDNRSRYTVRDTRTAQATETLFDGDASVTDYRWVVKDAPALKKESFTSTVKNHISKIEFQLSDQRPPLAYYNYMGSWEKLSTDLLKDEDFGNSLDKNNGWMADVVNPLVSGEKNDVEKAKRIYNYVRDNLTCTQPSGKYLSQSLKNILKSRNGNVADINLLLVAMLKYANLQADPVILSTRSNGYTSPVYPVLDKFNYVICKFSAGNNEYYLDATHPRLGFGKLTAECYNGSCRVIDQAGTELELRADDLAEKKLTTVIINSNEKGELVGKVQQYPGYFESYSIRDRVKEKGKEEFFKDIKKSYGADVDLVSPRIDSLDKLEGSLAVSYEFKINKEKEDILYINPMFEEAWKENPFKSAERLYPVEMPYTTDETYVMTMLIPDGYAVDELPKSTMVKLNENDDGVFEYRITESGGTISFRSRIQLRRAFYLPDEYEVLREFFNLVVKKQSEQIVLKKKK
jgi:transglutaminase-like putative cysteine protease